MTQGIDKYRYKFSIVIPVYNVEKYLEETLNSIFKQTIGFTENCEIILINDGSDDNSSEICERFAKKYPANIRYIEQANQGPCAARNRGLAEARGKYISLLDSDDQISNDTLEEVYDFFEQHYEEIDFVSIKQLFFDARSGEHPLNYKFATDRVINLEDEYDHIQMSAASSFFKQEVFSCHNFDHNVGRYAEDSKFMGEVALTKQKYGVLSKPIYYYRKRHDQASSLDTNTSDPYWYLETPQRAFDSLFKYAENKKGYIPKFIQFMAMYDIQWRLKQEKQIVLDHKLEIRYKNQIYKLIRHIDDDVIMTQKQLPMKYKLFALSKKYQVDIKKLISKEKDGYYYKDNLIVAHEDYKPKLHIDILEIDTANILKLEGYLDGFLFGDEKIVFHSSGVILQTRSVIRKHKQITFLGDVVHGFSCYQISIPLAGSETLNAYITGYSKPLPLVFHRFTRLNQNAVSAFRRVNNLVLKRTVYTLNVALHSKIKTITSEFLYWLIVLQRLELSKVKARSRQWLIIMTIAQAYGIRVKLKAFFALKWALIPIKSTFVNISIIFYRILYWFSFLIARKPVWIISDRMNAADDNGEVFFRYLIANGYDKKFAIYFAINKSSPDFSRLKKLGPVVDYSSLRYKVLFLLSSKVISSEATEYVINPFGRREEGLMDLMRYDFIFLQHGIIRDDISEWLNKYNKNIKLFITSAIPEYKSIIEGDYGYDAANVRLTGLPRFDLLGNDTKNRLIIAPTWRDNLTYPIDQRTGERPYNPSFKYSDYYNFFQNLINDDRLMAVLTNAGMKGELILHPSFQQQVKDFKGNALFSISKMPHDYPRIKREGSFLVTDYSSVALDFAFLEKPILYAQFDRATYYKLSTSQQGYLSYERDGLGPVALNYEDTVNQIITTINSGCIMDEKYKERLNDFFAYRDKNNCQRVYEAIVGR